VTLSDRLLREPRTSFRGRYYAADEAPTAPGCVQRPRIPFAIAATGPRGMRLAAAFGATWVTTGDRKREGLGANDGARVIAAQGARLEEVCAALGREPRTLARMVLTGVGLRAGVESVEAFQETLGRYGEVGVTDLVVHWPRAAEPYAGELASFERVINAARAV
jgi:alkanesulfonate monooxygenase SsuD/methylene tetrahydromethanopterin reductase-like flavin-dependent oxidoreductase (luciferase family)